MNKKRISGLITLVALAVVALSSCNKLDIEPTIEGNNIEEKVNDENNVTKNVTYQAGIVSNDGYPIANQTKSGFYRLYSNVSIGQQTPTLYPFGNYIAGSTYPTVMVGCAATKNLKVYAFKDNQGVTWLQSDQGHQVPVLNVAGDNLFTLPIEEIEIYPNSTDVYLLCKGSSMSLYRVNLISGTTTLMTYNGVGNIFNNTLGNGYKSGSIAFVPNTDGTFRLVYTTESNVYSYLGLVTWHYNISGSTLQIQSSLNRTYTTAATGIGGAQSGKINTTFGDGKFYFARDNSPLYSIELSKASNDPTATHLETPVGVNLANTNDFGYFKNL